MNEIFRMKSSELKCDDHQIVKLLGYGNLENVDERVMAALPGITREVRRQLEPIALFKKQVDFVVGENNISISCGPTFQGSFLSKAMKPASEIILFALTMGLEISAWLDDLGTKDVWTAYIADAVASEYTENFADSLHGSLKMAKHLEHMHTSLRYSPGYCDWPVEEMLDLLRHLHAEDIGISITAGGMMTPRKSICGIMGFGPDSAAMNFNPCNICRKRDCMARRTEKTL